MLIRFVTSNFFSFNDEIEFSMVPGRSRKHPHHIIRRHSRNSINILKAAVIYGANASGKSNLIQAMAFARHLILEGTRPKKLIPIKRFQLDIGCAGKVSKFEFEFKSKDKYYVYGFELDNYRIYNEWLYEISRASERMIFERKTTNDNQTEIEFGRIEFKDKKEKQFLEFTGVGTRYNQLFLTESLERGVEHFSDAYSWFRDLTFIFPASLFNGLEISIEEEDELIEHLLELLQLFNTGISGISFEKIDFESEVTDFPDEFREDLIEDVDNENKVVVRAPDDRRYLIYRDEADKIKAFKLMTKHPMKNSDEEASLEISYESDGTRRLLELLPALIDMLTNNRVYIVDEFDRSLHPTLSYKILELFLNNKLKRESQLIVTTHESSLLNLNLLRRDEIWFVEKDSDGVSSVYSLEEFTPRYDKDVRKGYLLGRFGAIPIVQNVSDLGWVR